MIKSMSKIMNKKGSLIDIFIWIIIGFITVVFLGAWVFMNGIVTEALVAVPTNNGVNVSGAAQQIAVPVNDALAPGLHLLSFSIIIGLMLNIYISNFLVKGNPVFFILYIFITISAVILSAIVSNIYEGLLAGELLGTTLLGFRASNFILLNLPLWSVIISLTGAVFLFVNIQRDSDVGGVV